MKTIKEHKKAVIIISIILFVILIAFGLLFNAFFGEVTRRGNLAVKKYNGGYYDVTPYEQRGNTQKETNYFHQKNMGIFTAISSVLTADYFENDYQEQKEILMNSKTDEAIGKNWSAESFSIDEWFFIVDKESTPPKSLTIFGFNDEKQKIAYIKFNDRDLDEITESPQEFFNMYIKYKF